MIRTRILAAAGLCAFALTVGPAAAQVASLPSVLPPTGGGLRVAVPEGQADVLPQDVGPSEGQWYFGAGVRFFSTLGTSGAIEITRARDNGRGNTRGWTATAELGEGGHEFFVGRRHAGNLWNGASLGAAYISTDDDARGVAGGQAFLGPEFRITMLGVGLAMGHYWRIDGSAPGDARLFDASFLIGIW